MKKYLKTIFACFALAACTLSFSACGRNNDGDGNDVNGGGNGGSDVTVSGTEFTFEAEYTDLDDLSGAGSSNSAEGTQMILSSEKASGGHYIGFTHKKGLTFTFEINSDKAAEATLKIGLSPLEGMDAITLNPTAFIVKINGTALNYSQINVVDSNTVMSRRDFKKYNFGTVNLAQGENVITLTIGENDYVNGGSGGPGIDAVYLTTEAALDWTPLTENID